MKLLSILLIGLGFHFSFAAEIPANTEDELRAASPELMKLLDDTSRAEDKNKNLKAMDENDAPLRTSENSQDLESTN